MATPEIAGEYPVLRSTPTDYHGSSPTPPDLFKAFIAIAIIATCLWISGVLWILYHLVEPYVGSVVRFLFN